MPTLLRSGRAGDPADRCCWGTDAATSEGSTSASAKSRNPPPRWRDSYRLRAAARLATRPSRDQRLRAQGRGVPPPDRTGSGRRVRWRRTRRVNARGLGRVRDVGDISWFSDYAAARAAFPLQVLGESIRSGECSNQCGTVVRFSSRYRNPVAVEGELPRRDTPRATLFDQAVVVGPGQRHL